MTEKDIRKINEIVLRAKMAMLDIYAKLPDELRNDDTFDYFFLSLSQDMILSLKRWKTDYLMGIKNEMEEEEE
jgi:hypothetical protein